MWWYVTTLCMSYAKYTKISWLFRFINSIILWVFLYKWYVMILGNSSRATWCWYPWPVRSELWYKAGAPYGWQPFSSELQRSSRGRNWDAKNSSFLDQLGTKQGRVRWYDLFTISWWLAGPGAGSLDIYIYIVDEATCSSGFLPLM